MNTKHMSERLNKINQPMIKGSQVIGKMTVEHAKKMADVQASLANHMAKNIQSATTNIFTAKNPGDIVSAIKGDGGSYLLQEWQDYQTSMQKVVDIYMKELSQVNEEIYEHTKDGFNEFLESSKANSPDGLGMMIKPYQSVLNAALSGAEQFQMFTKNYIEGIDRSLKNNFSIGNEGLKSHTSKVKSVDI